jgi:Tol biopolymer transport system component
MTRQHHKPNQTSMKTILTLAFAVFSNFIFCQTDKVSIDYFGQTPPDTVPVVFAPGIICLDNRFEGCATFSPDGNSFYFTITNKDYTFQKILYCKYIDQRWTTPDTASFSKLFNNHEPVFSPDGQKLYFTSDRDKKTKENKRDFFVVNKAGDDWSEPVKLDTPLNSEYTEYFFNQSKSGTIYFASNRPGGYGMLDIYSIKQVDGRYVELTNLGNTINTIYSGDPCIAPDESYLIYSGVRTLAATSSDLYISFKENGVWSEPVNMGNRINTWADEYGPFFSPDGKYLFFIRHSASKGDIFWVDTRIINNFRHQQANDSQAK